MNAPPRRKSSAKIRAFRIIFPPGRLSRSSLLPPPLPEIRATFSWARSHPLHRQAACTYPPLSVRFPNFPAWARSAFSLIFERQSFLLDLRSANALAALWTVRCVVICKWLCLSLTFTSSILQSVIKEKLYTYLYMYICIVGMANYGQFRPTTSECPVVRRPSDLYHFL